MPGSEFNVRSLEERGQRIGFIVDTNIEGDQTAALLEAVMELTGELDEDKFNTDVIGSSLGESFFKETMIALVIAFLLMGTVVFIYFRVFVPSIAVILSAFSDIIVTLAIVNLLGIKISTAGLAAFLMLIGYSVDTDILLTTRMLKRDKGSLNERLFGAFKTGTTMTLTSLLAILFALVIVSSFSLILSQIFMILAIGLAFDLLNTWITNASVLKWYVEAKNEINLEDMGSIDSISTFVNISFHNSQLS